MYVRVHVLPSAKKEKVIQDTETTFTVSVKEPAEGNRANARVRELLALQYHVAENAVRIVTGHHSPHKIFDITV